MKTNDKKQGLTLVLSTKHITKKTQDLMENRDKHLPGVGCTANSRCGFILLEGRTDEIVDALYKAKPKCYDLIFLVCWAHIHGFTCISFEDGETPCDEFPVFTHNLHQHQKANNRFTTQMEHPKYGEQHGQ